MGGQLDRKCRALLRLRRRPDPLSAGCGIQGLLRQSSWADMARSFLIVVPILLLLSKYSSAQNDAQIVQADVYNALYEAYVECDPAFSQSRSEFIVEKLKSAKGRFSIESLRAVLTHQLESAKEAVAEMSADREAYIAQSRRMDERTLSQSVDQTDGANSFRKEAKKLDALLEIRREYVKVHECILGTL